MKRDALAALADFLEDEKKIAEHQVLALSEKIPALKKQVRHWESRFIEYRTKPVWYLPYLAYIAIRLEGAKSDLQQNSANLNYHSEAQKKISIALDGLLRGDFDKAVIALLHISTMRPIDTFNPFDDDASTLKNPRFVASYFLDEMRTRCGAR